ncbi:MAG: hypothetical protein JO079_12825 [Frankiaceae bacterium]|nr:hypothetical protein [Frankiaceae bacterium]MBV9368639.1 hypothetical protein [Frankiales bacterium]
MQPLRLGAAITAVLVSVAGLSGCSGGSKPQAQPAPTQSLYTPPPCPTPAKATQTKWPAFLPPDIPKPANAAIMKGGISTTADGVHIVRFTTPSSLRESVLFIVQKYPKAGYTLGRGDAESTEADAPFVHGEIRGVTRISQLAQCQTLWLTATVNVKNNLGNTPIITPHTPSSSPSPLPFG